MKKLMMAVMAVAAAFAAIADDYSFTYQAELKDSKGDNLASRNQTVEIRLWKTAAGTSDGDLLWGRTYNIYTDENGMFNQEISDSLGSLVTDWPLGKTVLPLSAVFSNYGAGTVYLGLKVKSSSGEIAPRQRIFAVPFAGRANSANNLVGDTHTVEGTLKIGADSSLSSSGLVLPSNSSSTMGNINAATITCTGGDLSVANVNFTGKLTDGSGKEIMPVPVGGIIMWTDSKLPDDEHWAVCDGSTKNGVTTPDLSGRFIVGVGKSSNGDTTYSYGNVGGEEKHQLTVDEMANHSHSWTDWSYNGFESGKDSGWKEAVVPGSGGVSGSGSKITFDATGDDKPHENRPPYYALYYIMRIK